MGLLLVILANIVTSESLKEKTRVVYPKYGNKLIKMKVIKEEFARMYAMNLFKLNVSEIQVTVYNGQF